MRVAEVRGRIESSSVWRRYSSFKGLQNNSSFGSSNMLYLQTDLDSVFCQESLLLLCLPPSLPPPAAPPRLFH